MYDEISVEICRTILVARLISRCYNILIKTTRLFSTIIKTARLFSICYIF